MPLIGKQLPPDVPEEEQESPRGAPRMSIFADISDKTRDEFDELCDMGCTSMGITGDIRDEGPEVHLDHLSEGPEARENVMVARLCQDSHATLREYRESLDDFLRTWVSCQEHFFQALENAGHNKQPASLTSSGLVCNSVAPVPSIRLKRGLGHAPSPQKVSAPTCDEEQSPDPPAPPPIMTNGTHSDDKASNDGSPRSKVRITPPMADTCNSVVGRKMSPQEKGAKAVVMCDRVSRVSAMSTASQVNRTSISSRWSQGDDDDRPRPGSMEFHAALAAEIESCGEQKKSWTRASRAIKGNRALKEYRTTKEVIMSILRCHQVRLSVRVLLCRIVLNSKFDVLCGFVILFNAMIIGAETDYQASHEGESLYIYQHIGLVLNSWYICELALRMAATGKQFVFGPNWRWNMFDTVLISTSLLDMVLESFAFSGLMAGRLIRITRLIRIVRLLRVMHMLRYVREFRKLVFSLASSMQTLFWSLLLLFFVIFCFSVFFTQQATDLARTSGDESLVFVRSDFGSLASSMYSLYLAITNGKAWGSILEPLMMLSWSGAVCFLVFVSICLFGVMNVITAVFVESAMQSSKYYKDLMVEEKLVNEQTCVKHIKEIFKQMDTDGSGSISYDEMYTFVEDGSSQLQTYFEALDLNATDTMTLFNLLDRDKSGVIDIEEFCDGCIRLRGNARSFDLNSLQHENRRAYAQMLRFNKWFSNCIKSDGTRDVNFQREVKSTLKDLKDILGKITPLSTELTSVMERQVTPAMRAGRYSTLVGHVASVSETDAIPL